MDLFFPTQRNFFWGDVFHFGSCGGHGHSGCGEFGSNIVLDIEYFSFSLQHQQGKYQEVAVSGDLSEGDLKQANATLSAFEVIRLFSLPLSS